MRVFIELPTWLGDSVMASAAIENLVQNEKNLQIVFFGSFVACELYKSHPNCEKVVVDESKKAKFRFLSLAKSAKSLGKFDLALSFRSSFASKFLLFFINARQKALFKKSKTVLHQVLKYANFVKNALGLREISTDLRLYFTPKILAKKTLALNPGASYGSAKRWYPEYFAQVALNFRSQRLPSRYRQARLEAR